MILGTNVNTNRRIHLDLSPGWEDHSIFFFKGPDQAGVQHSLSVQIDDGPGSVSLTDYAKDRIAMMQASQPGMVVLKEGESQLDDGTASYEFVYKYNPGGEVPFFSRHVFVFRDGKALTFAGRYAKQTARTHGVAIDQMIRSFRLGDSA